MFVAYRLRLWRDSREKAVLDSESLEKYGWKNPKDNSNNTHTQKIMVVASKATIAEGDL